MSSVINRYRPQTFGDMVGNRSLVESVAALFAKPPAEQPHALLFSGMSGIGKTTIARIIAGRLREGGTCGVNEINAADCRGIDAIRAYTRMAEQHHMTDTTLFILDECHQLTKEAQSALLKSLEDAPSDVYWILCTTEPERLHSTLRTRCSSYDLKPVEDDEMIELLLRVSAAEGAELKDDVGALIVANACGSPRLALNMLERCLDCDDVAAAKEIISTAGWEFRSKGEFEVSRKAVQIVFDAAHSAAEKHAALMKLLVEEIVDGAADRGAVHAGTVNLLGGYLRNARDERTAHLIAEMVLFLEAHPVRTNASLYAVFGRLLSLWHNIRP